MSGTLDVGRAALRGGVALVLRQVLVQGCNIVAGVLLARWLSPADFGVYALMAFVLNFLIVFGDVGLGASLVRQPTEPSLHEYRAVFSFQQLGALFFCAALWLLAPPLAHYFHLGAAHVWLFRGAGLALFITSFQTIAAIRLEREIGFQKLAVVEVAQALVYNGTLIAGIALGLGLLTFPLALVLRALIGAVYINLRHPWPLGWAWDWPLLRSHLAFGLPYQGVSFTSLIKDSFTPFLIGGLIGLHAVGYINWAQTVAAYPVMALMVLQRLYMPVFARLQADRAALTVAVGRVLLFTNLITAALATLTLVLAVPITELVFGSKWLVALPIFYLLWVGNLFVATSTPLLALANALGHSRLAFTFALVWLLSTWLLGLPLVLRFGAVGFALANVGVQLTNLALFATVRRLVPIDFRSSVVGPWLSLLPASALLGLLVWRFPPTSLAALVAYALLGIMMQAASVYLARPELRQLLHRQLVGRRART